MRARSFLIASAKGLALCALMVAGAALSPWGQAARQRAARGECPFPHGAGQGLAKLAGEATMVPRSPEATENALSRSAFGLTFAQADAQAVWAWGKSRQMACRKTRPKAHSIECQTTEGHRLSPLWQGADKLTVVFHFDEAGALQAVRAMGSYQDNGQATQALNNLVQQAQADIGGAPEAHEIITQDIFDRGLLTQVRVAYPRNDLYTDLSGTKMVGQVSVQQYVQAL